MKQSRKIKPDYFVVKLLVMTNKKPRNKSHWAFYGAGDGSQLEPSPNIYLEIIKELVHSSTVIFDIKTILKYSITN